MKSNYQLTYDNDKIGPLNPTVPCNVAYLDGHNLIFRRGFNNVEEMVEIFAFLEGAGIDMTQTTVSGIINNIIEFGDNVMIGDLRKCMGQAGITVRPLLTIISNT